ncbi:MAG: PTS sugar transporter subunit IIA [Candidatus Synoicihabitans palmerolidicus]|nr:PTS sugar transporter subunit IIA [Candidatus Synoicihabitans palmerolidicus]
MGNGVALPHARTDHVTEPLITVGRSERSIYFEKADQQVQLMFVLTIPKHNPSAYLTLVNALCRLMKSAEHRAAFLAAESPEAFIAAIKAAEDASESALGHFSVLAFPIFSFSPAHDHLVHLQRR